jgi:uncharacterized membrane protein YsdA (DUF1294 family)
MIDPRNRPYVLASVIVGLAVAALLAWLGLSILVAWMAGWSVPAFAMYGIDKRQARRDGWRVPEAVLHLLALIGGVVGAWAGRYVFRHKTRRPEFTLVLIAASVLWVIIVWTVLG